MNSDLQVSPRTAAVMVALYQKKEGGLVNFVCYSYNDGSRKKGLKLPVTTLTYGVSVQDAAAEIMTSKILPVQGEGIRFELMDNDPIAKWWVESDQRSAGSHQTHCKAVVLAKYLSGEMRTTDREVQRPGKTSELLGPPQLMEAKLLFQRSRYADHRLALAFALERLAIEDAAVSMQYGKILALYQSAIDAIKELNRDDREDPRAYKSYTNFRSKAANTRGVVAV